MTVSDLASLFAIIFGTIGAVLGGLGYFRDRPKVRVELNWDMSMSPGALQAYAARGFKYAEDKLWGMVVVANTGRRPIFVSHVHLKLPKGSKHDNIFLIEGVQGARLQEGDAPQTYLVDPDRQGDEGLHEIVPLKEWHKVVAVVIDSAGKKYTSKRADRSNKPKWVNEG